MPMANLAIFFPTSLMQHRKDLQLEEKTFDGHKLPGERPLDRVGTYRIRGTQSYQKVNEGAFFPLSEG
jgi:hypothetical protein